MEPTPPADPPQPPPAAPPTSPPSGGGSILPQVLIGAAVGAVVLGLGGFVLSRGGDLFRSGGDGGEPVLVAGETAPPPAPADPFAGWKKPAVAVVLSGEVHGYLEPCGCSAKQNGGVARRSSLFELLREEKGWDVVAADAGGTVRRNRLQTEFKFAAMREALAAMGYGTLNLGPEELRLGMDYLVQHVGDDPPLTGANVALLGDTSGQTAHDTGIARTRVLEAGGVKVGFAGVVGDSMAGELAESGPGALIGVGDAEALLPAALAELADCDVRILLSQAEPDETRGFLERFPGFHAAVTAGGPEDPDPTPEVVQTDAGEALLLRVGQKGKSVGVLGVYPDAGGEGNAGPGLTYALATLSKDRYEHDREMDVIMAGYQRAIADNLPAIFEDIDAGDPPKPGGYVGAAKCGECHTKAYAKWKDSPHAHAYASLTEGRAEFEGDWADRRLDPECLSCHVTGWDPQGYFPRKGGFLPESLAAGSPRGGAGQDEGLGGLDRYHLLAGQQCENCHGPGSGHTATFERWKADPSAVSQSELRAANAAVHVDLATAADTTCIRCHDGNNSPDFNFAEYWPKVRHPWRD